jgi:hypothetical protein
MTLLAAVQYGVVGPFETCVNDLLLVRYGEKPTSCTDWHCFVNRSIRAGLLGLFESTPGGGLADHLVAQERLLHLREPVVVEWLRGRPMPNMASMTHRESLVRFRVSEPWGVAA